MTTHKKKSLFRLFGSRGQRVHWWGGDVAVKAGTVAKARVQVVTSVHKLEAGDQTGSGAGLYNHNLYPLVTYLLQQGCAS